MSLQKSRFSGHIDRFNEYQLFVHELVFALEWVNSLVGHGFLDLAV